MKKHDRAGEVLREIREKMNLTQYEFADKVGVHPQMVSNWERGLCSPPKNKLKKIFMDQDKSVRSTYVHCAVLDNKAALMAEFLKVGLITEVK